MESPTIKRSLMMIRKALSSLTKKNSSNNSGQVKPRVKSSKASGKPTKPTKKKTPAAKKTNNRKKIAVNKKPVSAKAKTKANLASKKTSKKTISKPIAQKPALSQKPTKAAKKIKSKTDSKTSKASPLKKRLKPLSEQVKKTKPKNQVTLKTAKVKPLVKKLPTKVAGAKKKLKKARPLKKKLKLVKALVPKKKLPRVYIFKKSPKNPIISPNGKNSWESWQTFNPAALYLDGQVHFLYRAIGDGGVSVLGYAASPDGIKVTKRQRKPAYVLKEEFFDELRKGGKAKFFTYASGGSAAGCEDPRLTEIDGRVYMIHTTFSNWLYLRMTMTSISKDDFVNRRWHKWTHPIFISAPGEVHKNWVMFPEKIKGKYVILNSISPKLSVSYLDSLKFDNKTFIKSYYKPAPVANGWEEYRRGVGPTPIKTKAGWLLFYHAVEKHETHKYKIGAMILDKNNPEKIVYTAKDPVLEPDMVYENQGFKPGIVYSCGAVVINGQLFIYYGGADTVICVATANLNEFVDSLVAGEKPKLSKTTLLKNKK